MPANVSRYYVSKIRSLIDWAKLDDLLHVERDWNEPRDTDRYIGMVCIGTVFDLFPSGKFYMPWANSNVTEAEAARDERYQEALEYVAEKFGGYIENSEGDPCDVMFCKTLTREEAIIRYIKTNGPQRKDHMQIHFGGDFVPFLEMERRGLLESTMIDIGLPSGDKAHAYKLPEAKLETA